MAVFAAAALMAAPAGARAATVIGSTVTPVNGCAFDAEFLGGGYSAPSAGVITQWRYQAAATDVPHLKLKVARPAGGNDFTMVGESGVQTPVPSTLNSYPVRIAVQAGDVIGVYLQTSGLCVRPDPSSSYFVKFGDDPPQTTAPFSFSGPGSQLAVSALLEPDCDRDGLGDETQDPDISSCTPAAAPAPAPALALATGQQAAALKRCKKKHKKALKKKRAHGELTKPVRKHLRKKFKTCKKKASRLPV